MRSEDLDALNPAKRYSGIVQVTEAIGVLEAVLG
jgi:hypothetical protein